MANHNLPTQSSPYLNFVTELDARFDDLCLGLDPARTTMTNLPTNSVGWSSAGNKWQRWTGTAWADLASTYSISISGNASTASQLQTSRTINGVSFNGSANINVPTQNSITFSNTGGAAVGTTFNGSSARTISYVTVGAPSSTGDGASGTWGINITGSAPTLTTARTINGTSFNGSANITTNTWGTGRTLTIGSTGKSVNGSANISWSLSEIGAVPVSGGTMTGSLGINTSPTVALDVSSTEALLATFRGSTIQYHGISIRNSYGNSSRNSAGFVDFRNENDINVANLICDMYLDGSSGISFDITRAGSRTIDRRSKALSLFTNGAFPQSSILQVMGASGQSGLVELSSEVTNGTSYLYVGHKNGVSSGNWYAGFAYNGAAVGSITQNGTTGVTYNSTSDYRLKNNPQPISGYVDFIMALKPKSWEWVDGSGQGVGFIAHEFAEVAKHSVTGEKDAVDENGNPVYQSMQASSPEVMANLIALVQDQQRTIQALISRIDTIQKS